MKTSPFLVNLMIYGPYVILFILFLIFFYRAIRFHGLTKLKKFTSVMLGAFLVAFALRYFNFHYFDLVPIQLLKISGNDQTTNLLIFLMMVFFVISMSKIRTEKKPKLLSVNWLLIELLSVAYIIWLVYLYILWKEPAINPNAPFVQRILLQHISQPSAYLRQLFYPVLWALAAGISLWKIRKEKRRLL